MSTIPYLGNIVDLYLSDHPKEWFSPRELAELLGLPLRGVQLHLEESYRSRHVTRKYVPHTAGKSFKYQIVIRKEGTECEKNYVLNPQVKKLLKRKRRARR